MTGTAGVKYSGMTRSEVVGVSGQSKIDREVYSCLGLSNMYDIHLLDFYIANICSLRHVSTNIVPKGENEYRQDSSRVCVEALEVVKPGFDPSGVHAHIYINIH